MGRIASAELNDGCQLGVQGSAYDTGPDSAITPSTLHDTRRQTTKPVALEHWVVQARRIHLDA
jgi:hypothetical protein